MHYVFNNKTLTVQDACKANFNRYEFLRASKINNNARDSKIILLKISDIFTKVLLILLIYFLYSNDKIKSSDNKKLINKIKYRNSYCNDDVVY